MASKSFLTDSEWQRCHDYIKKNTKLRRFGALRYNSTYGSELSRYMGDILLNKFSSNKYWKPSKPVLVGSWAREELCPKSDLDILFIGPEASVKKFIGAQLEFGLKVMSRVPENLDDWSEGVQIFDQLSYFNGIAVFDIDKEALTYQINQFSNQQKTYKKTVLSVLLSERDERKSRHDSVINYIEPNLKYGPGGLRDLQQAKVVIELFPERFIDAGNTIKKIESFYQLLLAVRQILHFEGGGDLLAAPFQSAVAKHFGISDYRKFAKELQKGFSEASFYSDWVLERAKSGATRIKRLGEYRIGSLNQAFRFLHKNHSTLAQARVFWQINSKFKLQQDKSITRGKLLKEYFTIDQNEHFMLALFRSGLLGFCVPALNRVKGVVQHDQYHKYTVDQHSFQAVKEAMRAAKKPKELSSLFKVLEKMQSKDFQIILWASLYHDLGKGGKTEHSKRGGQIVKKDFVAMKLSLNLTTEVAWLVQNHLILSQAAFRRNPNDPSTWKWAADKGLFGKRVDRLALLTVIDIKATNPEALNSWKIDLIVNTVKILKARNTQNFMEFLKDSYGRGLTLSEEFINTFDPYILNHLPKNKLLADFEKVKKAKSDLPVAVLKEKEGIYWIRFHRIEDRPGLFYGMVERLFSAGALIQHSFVQTLPRVGVYDWFQVKCSMNKKRVQATLQQSVLGKPSLKPVEFSRVTLVSSEGDSSVISFKGKNQRGLLLTAVAALAKCGFNIQWARVNTWGRQIEDVFGVEFIGDIDDVFEKLKHSVVIVEG